MTLAECSQRGERLTGWAAVMFDLDGTLVDSQRLHRAAYIEAMDSIGVRLDPLDYDVSHGQRFDAALGVMLAGRELQVSPEELHARKSAVLSRLIQRDGIALLPAAGLVPLLSGIVPIALVTSASEASVAIVLRQLGWEDAFDTVVHGGDQVDPKPSPAPYLAAARRLGVAADRCLVFEDSDVGAASARAAGMTVIDVGSPGAP